MAEIKFWTEHGDKKYINHLLFSTVAEGFAKELCHERNMNNSSQIRKFYDEVVRLNDKVKSRADSWYEVLPYINMILAKVTYARGRKLVNEVFVNMMKTCVGQVKEPQDMTVFANFFEAVIGFHKAEEEQSKGHK